MMIGTWMKGAGAMALLALATGCAQQQVAKYNWGDYESAMYNYYQTPATSRAFADKLLSAIQASESAGKKVPPGMYAEYGELMYEAGDNAAATTFFEKEKSTWPESSVLMTNMIRLASSSASRPADKSSKTGDATTPVLSTNAAAANLTQNK
ncbi:DUF4810 domain-containing protein [Paraburkholderia sp.]|uniref:DUF4810 domain-containing protein n=1 Tax=Paraburkholderia sp. TaxID=1926495 RepID=UPI00238CC230|nr:DUF4810 domain-containing protein [Paraburkholderia sp.]MDE1181381.1 DUF4810 domain-containing protein [Paraburkholderia sp.]